MLVLSLFPHEKDWRRVVRIMTPSAQSTFEIVS